MEKTTFTILAIRYELMRELKMREKVYPAEWGRKPSKKNALQLQQKKMEYAISIFDVMTPQEFSEYAKRIEARTKTMAAQGSLFAAKE